MTYYDPSTFQFVKRFVAACDQIADECRRLPDRMHEMRRGGPHSDYVAKLKQDNAWMPSWQVGSSESNHQWLTYGLSYRGVFPDDAALRFPSTMAVLKEFPGIIVSAFSRMTAQSFIAPHRHPELGGDLLTFHLGLSLQPKRSYLCVDGIFEEEVQGKPIIFDGSKEHFAFNFSDETRIVLYVEFDRSRMA